MRTRCDIGRGEARFGAAALNLSPSAARSMLMPNPPGARGHAGARFEVMPEACFQVMREACFQHDPMRQRIDRYFLSGPAPPSPVLAPVAPDDLNSQVVLCGMSMAV